VGEKTAVELLEQFDTLEQILENADRIKRAAIRENLKTHAQQARLSKKLVTIDTAVPLELGLEDLVWRGFNNQAAAALSREFEFNSLLPRFTESATPVSANYQLVNTPKEVQALARKLAQISRFAFDTETTSADPLRAELVGMSFAWEEGAACYVPVAAPQKPHDLSDFFLDDGKGDFSLKAVFQPLLENTKIEKCGQNTKYDRLVMARYSVNVAGANFDTMVASYVLNPSQRQHNLDALSLEHFNYRKIPTSDLIGTGKKQITMREVPPAEVARYAGEDADFTLRLCQLF
jgi:DNA polymerase-1